MSDPIPFIKSSDFDNVVLKTAKLVIVNFWAAWCGKCKAIDPLLDELVREGGGKFTIVKIDLDKEPNILRRFPLVHVPTLLFFKKGEICDKIDVAVPKKTLLEKIETHTSAA